MTVDPLVLVDRLHEEHEIAPPAAMLSDSRGHYDREVAMIMAARDTAVLPALLAKVGDNREVLKAKPPHLPVDGGYGKMFGHVTVADKARFALTRMLGEAVATEAIAQGPAWWRAHGAAMRWDARQGRFIRA